MYFTKMNVTKEQLEIMIAAIDMEFTYRNDYELAALMSRNFQINLVDIIDTLNAYKSCKDEDYELLSQKIEYAEL